MSRRPGLVAYGLAVFAATALLAAAAGRSSTYALWTDTVGSSPAAVQAAHATATATAASALLTPSSSAGASDPQQFQATVAPDQSVTYEPLTGCQLPGPGGGNQAYAMCVTYAFDADAAQSQLIAQIGAAPPAAVDTPMTYTVSAAVEVDVEAWGYFGVTLGYGLVTAPAAGSMLAASTVSASVAGSAQACPTAASASLDGTETVVPPGYADKKANAFVCVTQSYAPAVYQNTVTATNGDFTHEDSWWGTVYQKATGSSATLTIGLNPLQ
jgi:hypothetical protein